MREQTFHKQAAVLSDPNCSLSALEVQAVIEANHGPSIYDRLYSHITSESCSSDFDVILARITGLDVPEDSEKLKTSELNGLVKSSGRRSGMDNPYKRTFMNGGASRRRSSIYNSMSSGSETDSGAQPRKDSRLGLDSSASSTEHSLERKPLRDRNESKTLSPTPAKSPHKSSRKSAAMLGLDSGASSTEEEKSSSRKAGRLRSPPSSSKMNEESTSSKTASRLVSLGLDSDASSTEEEKPKHEDSKKSRNRKKPTASSKKIAEKEKTGSKAATMARLGLDSNGSSTEDEKPVRKLSTDASAPSKRRGRKPPVTPARVRKDTSSDDEDAVKKNKGSQLRNNLRKVGPDSDVKMSVSEDSDNDLLIRSSSKTDNKKFAAIYSDTDSDASKDESSSNMTADHHQNMMRTKGAMKEFSGFASKSGNKSPKKSTKVKSKDDKLADDVSKDKENIKSKKKDNTPTDLIVPQRQAAKKASESIQKVSQSRLKDFDVDRELLSKQISAEPEKTKSKSKAKEEDKKSKSGREGKLPPDVYEFDKDPDAAEILAYVPQRQAAKKANEHMKTGIKKTEKDAAEAPRAEKGKKETEADKLKKPEARKQEPRSNKLSKSSSSSSSSSTSSSSSSGSSSSSSSSSESDSESRSKSPAKKEVKSEKNSEPVSELKKVPAKKEERPFLGKVPKSSDSSSLDSDSDSDKDKDVKKPTTRPKLSPKEKDGSSLQLAGKTFRKAPDKKLKTSAGRPELELQQPPSERDESFRSKEGMGGALRTDSGDTSDRLRSVESGPAERRSGGLSDVKEPDSLKESQQARGRTRSKGAEESPRDRGRMGKQDPVAQKEQPKPGKRKSDESKDPSPLKELGSPIRRNETPRRGAKSSSPSKEESKSKHSPTEVKKVSKKIDLHSPERDFERRKSTRNVSIDSGSKVPSGSNLIEESKVLRSPVSGLRSPSLRSPKLAPESTIGLKHDEESLVKTMNSILTPDKDISALSKKPSPRKDVQDKNILDASRASSSSSSSSSSSTSNDDEANKDKSSQPIGPQLASDKILPPVEIDPKIPESVHDNIKHSSLESNIDFSASGQEPKKISSRSNSLSSAPYQQRSIFSPQQPKDSGVSDLFDFQNDLYAVDETVNDDGFGIPANSEDIMRAPLQFSFSNDHLFKDDTKEDTNRETQNLLDKLRQSYAQIKSQPGACDASDVPALPPDQADPDIEEVPVLPKTIEEVNLTDEVVKSQSAAPEITVPAGPHVLSSHLGLPSNALEVPSLNKHNVSPYETSNQEPSFTGYSCAVEAGMSKAMPVNQIIDSTKNVQADERWVPPSGSVYPEVPKESQQPPSLPLATPQHQLDLAQLARDPLALSSQPQHQELLPQANLQQPCSMPQDSEKSLMHHDQQPSIPGMSHDQFESMAQTPHMDSPLPYPENIHKWADRQVLPVRCNSTTSDDTDSDDDGHNNAEPLPTPEDPVPPASTELMAPYSAPSMPYPPCPMPEAPPYHSYSESAPFVNPLFPPSGFPGSNIYAPTYGAFPDHAHGMMPSIRPSEVSSMLQKLDEPPQQMPAPCTAAFTSSSHNMAFTAAMVSPLPSATPTPSPLLPQDPPLTPAAFPTSTAPPTPSPVLPHDTQPASTPYSSQTSLGSQTIISASEGGHQLPPVPSQTSKVSSSVGKKTPTKPTRSSPRVISLQQKSPGKSPGKSPRQEPAVIKTSNQSRGGASVKKPARAPRQGSQGRGRGRGKGKGRGSHHGFNDDFGICSKLAGTVYDLDFDDDDMTDSVENLRAMRERRKSTDVHERKPSESSYQDSSVSPKFTSPSHVSSKHRSTVYQNQNLSELRPPSPIHDGPSAADDDDDEDVAASPEPEETPEINQIQNFNDCVLPGPVDMRTYNSFEAQQTPAQPAPYNNLPGSLSTDQQEPDIAEDFEKEIQAADKEKEKQIEEPRVCLPESRQQLKVKIKGPFLDANYAAAAPTVTPMSQQQQPAMPAVAPLDSVQGPGMAPGSALSSASASGTSNLRRMRKKELLRQYCSQDMNMDEASAQAMPGHAVQPAPPVSRNVISIPKAVASMTTIPTREDYRAVVDANMEKKRKKDKIPTLSISYAGKSNMDTLDYEDVDETPERRRSVGSNGSNNSFPSGDVSQPLKRRGRAPRNPAVPSVTAEVATTPKLKIKIGANTAEVALSNPVAEKKSLRTRPPKKRQQAAAPCLEKLFAESMKYRSEIMKAFGGGEDDREEPEVVAPVAKKKKKKKKNSRSSSPSPLPTVPKVEVITNEVAAPKLIIRFGGKGNTSANSSTASNASVAPVEMGMPTQERTTEGPDASDSQVERLPLLHESQPLGETNASQDSLKAFGVGTDPDKSQTSDASALRKVRTSKSATIPKLKLKLARCEEGYVRKACSETVSNPDELKSDVEPPPENVHNMTDLNSLPLSQDCEVR